MKRMKKILALLTAATMALGMSVTSMAANGDAYRDENDTATVKITGIKPANEPGTNEDGETVAPSYPTVTLYRIAKADYFANNGGFKGYTWATAGDNFELYEINEEVTPKRFEVKIEEVAERLQLTDTDSDYASKHIEPLAVNEDGGKITMTVAQVAQEEGKPANYNAEATATVSAGAYIAIITGGGNTIYNPILLTATYGMGTNDEPETIQLVGGTIDTAATYLYGSTAVAKSTTPGLDKEITGGAATETVEDKTYNSASVGDKVTYTLTPNVPSYPADATNKTLYITDNMSTGLTFDYSTLSVALKTGDAAAVNATPSTLQSGEKEDEVAVTFSIEGKVIAKALKVDNGFRLVFVYDELVTKDTDGNVTGTKQPIVTYSAVINDQAVVGGDGNENTAVLKYTNDPHTTGTYDDPTKPEPTPDPETGKGVVTITAEKDESNTVYTYQLAFYKKNESNQKLPGATFGIYSAGTATVKDADGKITTAGVVDETKLIDVVTTNAEGWAVSGKVSSGKYYIKELKAPAGYSINDDVFEVEAKKATATTTTTKTVRTYTTTKSEEVPEQRQIGWLKVSAEDAQRLKNATEENPVEVTSGIFYELNEYTKESAEADGKVFPAYLKSVTSETSTVTNNVEGDKGTVFTGLEITNTTMTSLPSTGGIGTTIFTIGGCAIMILAAALYFATRRKTVR